MSVLDRNFQWIVFGIIFLAFAGLIIITVDMPLAPWQEFTISVKDKTFVPAHYTSTPKFDSDGNYVGQETVYVPDDYDMFVLINDKYYWIDISATEFITISIGNRYQVMCKNGRWFHPSTCYFK